MTMSSYRIVTAHVILSLLVVANGRVTATAAAFTEGTKANACCHSQEQYEDIPARQVCDRAGSNR